MPKEDYVPFKPTLTEENAEFASVELIGYFYKLSEEPQKPFPMGSTVLDIRPLYYLEHPLPEGWGEKMRQQYKGIPLEHREACQRLTDIMRTKAEIPENAFTCYGGGIDAARHNSLLNLGKQWVFQAADCYLDK